MQVCPLFALAFHMSTTAIDDTSTTLSYSGNWGGHTNETGNRFHGDSYHQVSGAGEVQIPFNGEWNGLRLRRCSEIAAETSADLTSAL